MRKINKWARFDDLIADDPVQVGTVTAHNADGTSTILYVGGGLVRLPGQTIPVGTKAFVGKGRIIGEAPDLPYIEIEV